MGNRTYTVAEMMYGSGETFEYFQCARCKCLQLAAIPTDIATYYPSTYYSFHSTQKPRPLVKQLMLDAICRLAVERSALQPLIRRLICRRYSVLSLIGLCRLQTWSHILDVGCGRGELASLLRQAGFRNAFGLDPYLPQNVRIPDGGVPVFRQTLDEHQGCYDLIMFHHSFEHVSDPLQTLLSVRRLLHQRGTCLIRMPTVSSWAWRHYQQNWCQVDAPRHTHIHSLESIRALAERAGLRLERIIYDSTELQFWGSERYTQGKPLHDDRDSSARPLEFTPAQLKRFRDQARKLNAENDGDQAAFYLVPDLHETR